MLIFNWLGIGLIVFWAAMLALTTNITHQRSHVLIGLLLGSAMVAALDLLLRLVVMKSNTTRLSILHPRSGGQLFFVPVWIIMALAGAGGILLFVRGPG